MQLPKDTDKIFEDKLQKKTGHVIKEDLVNTKHRPKARVWQTEARTQWRERDHCERTGSPAKAGRPETNTSFNKPDIQRNKSNAV